MARPKNIIPSKSVHLHLTGALGAQLDQLLYSEVEGRIPFGSHQKFFTELLVSYLSGRVCDLSHFAPPQLMVAPGTTVRGSAAAIETLQTLLKESL